MSKIPRNPSSRGDLGYYPSFSMTPFLLLILSSPSGAGKTTLTRRLLARSPTSASASRTRRASRGRTRSTADYHFVDRDASRRSSRRARSSSGPRSTTTSTAPRSPRSTARRRTPACGGMLFDIDYQGARQIRAKVPDVVGVFILPPSMPELERRLRGRASENEEGRAAALPGREARDRALRALRLRHRERRARARRRAAHARSSSPSARSAWRVAPARRGAAPHVAKRERT